MWATSSLSPHVVAAKREAFDIVGVRSGDGGVFPKDQKRQGFLKDTNEANKFREVHFFFIKVVATQIFLVSTPNPGEMIQFDYFVYYLG